jgi:hypothetical protein
MRREPLYWRADGKSLSAHLPYSGRVIYTQSFNDPPPPDSDTLFVIAPQLIRVYSHSREEFTGEPKLAWTLFWRGDFIVRPYDEYETPLFTLRAAMRMAERVRYAEEQGEGQQSRLRRWLRLRQISDHRFEQWLRHEYPSDEKETVAQRQAERWERFVDAEATRRLELEGREPTRVVVD